VVVTDDRGHMRVRAIAELGGLPIRRVLEILGQPED
jgi:hypothetical protein